MTNINNAVEAAIQRMRALADSALGSPYEVECQREMRNACILLEDSLSRQQLQHALQAMEDACEAIAARRTSEQYLSMIDADPGIADLLTDLDLARHAARSALATVGWTMTPYGRPIYTPPDGIPAQVVTRIGASVTFSSVAPPPVAGAQTIAPGIVLDEMDHQAKYQPATSDAVRAALPSTLAQPEPMRTALEAIARTTFSGSEMDEAYMRGNHDAHATCARMANAALATHPPAAPVETEPTKEDFAKWSRTWHDTCETIMTLLGLRGGGSPAEMLAEVQAHLGARSSAGTASVRDGIAAIVNDRTMINDEGFVQNSELVADLILMNFPVLNEPTALPEPNGLANLKAILADQPYQDSSLSVYEVNLILANKGGFMPDEATIWFREYRASSHHQ
ncbi:hypothetical protein [Bradyrhizobium sp. RT9a]|uniref:hypothetical protein n=1 Tax=Bradyrhizobium sp. RT9a TaxID=3156384 RepID=UPI003392A9AF